MAARKRLRLTDEHRKKIRVSMLINRLADHVDGKTEMSSTQVRAAETLLRKALPDLSSTELTGDVTQRVVGSEPISAEEWANQHAE